MSGDWQKLGEINISVLSINVFSVAYADNDDNFFRGIDFINNSVVAISEGITTFLVSFERFPGIRVVGEGIYVFCQRY